MIKEKIMKQLAEAKEEEKNLRAAVINGDTAEARASAQEALDKVIEKIAEINEIIAELDEPADPAPANDDEGERKIVKITEKRGVKEMDNNIEERAAEFAKSGVLKINTKGEARSVLVSSGKIATPTAVHGINDNMETPSSIIDMVNIVDANGMGSDKVAYHDTDATAATTLEGAAANESDPVFGFVEITPEKETVISYISEEVKAQTPLNYQAKVDESARKALRAKASAYVAHKLQTSSLVKALEVATATIDENTLRNIVLNYGGDENVQGSAVLFLNKADLIAFGAVRGSDKKPVYEIIPDAVNPNVGIIKEGGTSVKYCLNKYLTALTGSAKGAEAIKTMYYGNPLNFQLDLFSDYIVKVSEDYKFSEGLLAIRGAVQLGGDVVVKDGFVCVTLAAN